MMRSVYIYEAECCRLWKRLGEYLIINYIRLQPLLRKSKLNSQLTNWKPHLLVAITCDPNAPEILEQLGEGQTAFDRPDIIVRVFKAKVAAFIHNLEHGKYFGGKAEYITSWFIACTYSLSY